MQKTGEEEETGVTLEEETGDPHASISILLCYSISSIFISHKIYTENMDENILREGFFCLKSVCLMSSPPAVFPLAAKNSLLQSGHRGADRSGQCGENKDL